MSTTQRRNDPDRRARIIAATLEMLAEHGVSQVTHRKIAEAAGVPLGSMTYYFTGIDALICEAFTQFAEQMSDYFSQHLQQAENRQQAQEAVADIICGACIATPYQMQVMHQLYASAHCYPELKTIMQAWMKRSQQSLERFFDPFTARALDAFIEGMALHYMTDSHPPSRQQILEMIGRITTVERGE